MEIRTIAWKYCESTSNLRKRENVYFCPVPTKSSWDWQVLLHSEPWPPVRESEHWVWTTSSNGPCVFLCLPLSLQWRSSQPRHTNQQSSEGPRNNGSLEPKANGRKILFHRLKTWPTNEHFDPWDYWKLYILLWNGAFERHFKGYMRENIYKPHILQNA